MMTREEAREILHGMMESPALLAHVRLGAIEASLCSASQRVLSCQDCV